MNCNEVMEYMQRHLDGDLNREEQEKLHEHLRNCPECAEMMERLVRIDQDLASLPKVVPAFSLVDAILPRLEQIDAARRAEATASASLPHTGGDAGRENDRRPQRVRSGLLRYGSLAAAAVVLGVLVVNGLPDAFHDSRPISMQESSGGSAPMADMMLSAESAASSGSRSGQPAAAVGRSSSSADLDSPVADSGSATSGAPSAQITRKSGEGTSGNAASGNAASPEISKAQSVRGGQPEAESGNVSKGPDVGVTEAPSSLPPSAQEAPMVSRPAEEAAESYDGADAMSAPESLAPAEGGVLYFGFADQYAAQELMVSEDGRFAASVRNTEDGRIAVYIDLLDGGNAENRYVSSHQWDPAAAVVEVLGWSGTTVTYAVKTDGAERRFTIDAATGAESEIE